MFVVSSVIYIMHKTAIPLDPPETCRTRPTQPCVAADESCKHVYMASQDGDTREKAYEFDAVFEQASQVSALKSQSAAEKKVPIYAQNTG